MQGPRSSATLQGMALPGNERSVRTWIAWLVLKVNWLVAQVNYLLLGVAFISVKRYGAKGDGVTDDTSAINTAMTALAGSGIGLWFPPASTYLIASGPLTPPSGKSLVIWGYGATIVCTNLPATDPPTSGFLLLPVDSAFSSTLAASNTLGTSTLSLAASPAIGSLIQIVSNSGTEEFGLVFTVKNVSGGGPYTVTVDRPVLQSYANATHVQGLTSRPTDVIIYGLTIETGPARAYDVQCGLRCHLIDVKITQNGTGFASSTIDPCASFDVGSFDCWAIRPFADFPSNGCGFGGESSENCGIVDAVSPTCGYSTLDTVNFTIDAVYSGSTTSVDTATMWVGTNGASVARSTRILGGLFLNSHDACITVDAAVDTQIIGAQVGYTSGLMVEVTGNATDTRFVGLVANALAGTPSTGILIDTGATGTSFESLTLEGVPSGSFSMAIHADTSIRGLRFSGGTIINSSANLIVEGFDATPVAVAGAFGAASGSVTHISNGVCRFVSANSLFVDDENGGSVWMLEDCDFVGTDIATAIGVRTLVAGSTIRQGDAVRNVCGTPTSYVSGTFTNRKGTVVANGTTGVAVAWPDITADDVVLFTLQTAGGTVGHPTYTITPGTGFTFASQSLDTSTYEYTIP